MLLDMGPSSILCCPNFLSKPHLHPLQTYKVAKFAFHAFSAGWGKPKPEWLWDNTIALLRMRKLRSTVQQVPGIHSSPSKGQGKKSHSPSLLPKFACFSHVSSQRTACDMRPPLARQSPPGGPSSPRLALQPVPQAPHPVSRGLQTPWNVTGVRCWNGNILDILS